MSNRPSDFFGTASPKSVLNKPFMHLQDQKAYNVAGGTSVADAWTARDLNTVIHNDIQGASLAANEVTLPAGTYYVEGSAIRWFPSNISSILGIFNGSGVKLLQSTTDYTGAASVGKMENVSGVFTLSAANTITLRYYHGLAQATYGLGSSNSDGSIVDPTIPSIYADLKIWQLDRSLEVAPKAVNSGLQTVPSLDTTGNIMGFDISKTGANEVTITKGSCLDSTLEVPMALTVDTALAIPAVANTIYHVFLVRLVADGTFTVKAYTSEAAVASDVLVDKWRWIGFCKTNGSSEVMGFRLWGGNYQYDKASDSTFITGFAATTHTLLDLSSAIPVSRVVSCKIGATSTITATAGAYFSHDGVNTVGTIVLDSTYPISDTSRVWLGGGAGQNVEIDPSSVYVKLFDGSVSFGVFEIKLRR